MVKVTVCIGSSCHLKGSRQVVEELQRLVKDRGLDGQVELGGAFCMGKCNGQGVSVTVGDKPYFIDSDKINRFFDEVIIGELNKK